MSEELKDKLFNKKENGWKDLNDEEKEIVRRARNTQNHHLPKNSNVQEYMYSTAYEALIGYLFLTKKYDRLKEIIKIWKTKLLPISSSSTIKNLFK